VLSASRDWDAMSGIPMRLRLSEIYCHLTEVGIDDKETRREWTYLIQAADEAYVRAVMAKRPKGK